MSKSTWSGIEPCFLAQLIIEQLREGYWLECPDVNRDAKPDLVGYGLGMGEIYWYRNPDWSRFLIANKVKEPVGMDYADITGNGHPDVVICYQLYGEKGTIVDPDPEGGKIDWLENPGNPNNGTHRWERRYVGRTVAAPPARRSLHAEEAFGGGGHTNRRGGGRARGAARRAVHSAGRPLQCEGVALHHD